MMYMFVALCWMCYYLP